jgi:GH15 family glucan-1,4-alpha-glucosidase
MSSPIEDYALLGDGETAALLSREGSIDWLCWPRFDSAACLSALLGTPENGQWSLAPAEAVTHRSRRYQDDTLVMETDFETSEGAVRTIDFMPVRKTTSALVRIVVGLRGTVRMRCLLRLRFDYGVLPPWSEARGNEMVAKVGSDLVVLRAPVKLAVHADATSADFELHEGEQRAFVLSYGASHEPLPAPFDVDAALAATQEFWRGWISSFDNSKTVWPTIVRRSLITLKALIHAPTGGLVAAPTTSLPEVPAGKMNWDYRYCWLRDAGFTLCALLNAGFHTEAEAWRDWLLRAIAGSPEHLRIMYRVDGSRHLTEWTADTLPGYRHASPVRIGNAASTQLQIDVYGEVIDALDLARRGGLTTSAQETVVASRIVDYLAKVWNSKDAGIWESRGEPRHYTYSKVMAWVGLDRFISSPDQSAAVDGPAMERLKALRETIHNEICSEAWNEGLGTLTQYFGGQELDASLLLLPLVGFLPADDPRMTATIERIARELSEGGLIRRTKAKADGPNEGVFLPCSCWMADCLNMMGRREEALAQFERVLSVTNDLGLLSEEYNVPAGQLAGNFPQALTHLAVVNTALGLCGPTLQRGGG